MINQFYSSESHISNAITTWDWSSPFYGQLLSSERHASSLELLLHFLLADRDQCTTRVVLNKDFSCVSRQATSSQTGCRDQLQRKKAILPAGNHTCEAGSSGIMNTSAAGTAGTSVCVLSYDRKKDGDVIWFPPWNIRIKARCQTTLGCLLIACGAAPWKAPSLNIKNLKQRTLPPLPSQNTAEGSIEKIKSSLPSWAIVRCF